MTAVQKLYEWFLSDAVHTLDDVKKAFLQAQEEERQQIEHAYETGIERKILEPYKKLIK